MPGALLTEAAGSADRRHREIGMSGAVPPHDGTDSSELAKLLGHVTVEMLRETFPEWRIAAARGRWWAMRGGYFDITGGPGSLICAAVYAATLDGLADQLCLQAWLRSLRPAELEAVWRSLFPAAVP
jgi:hypothetical protein